MLYVKFKFEFQIPDAPSANLSRNRQYLPEIGQILSENEDISSKIAHFGHKLPKMSLKFMIRGRQKYNLSTTYRQKIAHFDQK